MYEGRKCYLCKESMVMIPENLIKAIESGKVEIID